MAEITRQVQLGPAQGERSKGNFQRLLLNTGSHEFLSTEAEYVLHAQLLKEGDNKNVC